MTPPAPTPERPLVVLPDRWWGSHSHHFTEIVGPEHGDPSGLLWQTRYAAASWEIIKALLADERIIQRSGGDISIVSVLLQEAIPVCCFLGSEWPRVVERARKTIMALASESRPQEEPR